MPGKVVTGVDLGGTRIRLVASGVRGRTGRLLWSRRVEARAPTRVELPGFIRRLWRHWGVSRGDVGALVVASKGIWTVTERRALKRRLRELAKRVEVISDAEAAFLGALGKRPGVLVLAGTGSIVLGRNRRGRWARAGGLGPLLGDEGSAFWIGRLWLKTASSREERLRRIARSPNAVRRIAALAPRVLRRAQRGERAARQFVASAHEILASFACQVAEDLQLQPPVAVSWAGSLMENRIFRTGVLRSLRRQGLRIRAAPPAQSAVEAAHALAENLARRPSTTRP